MLQLHHISPLFLERLQPSHCWGWLLGAAQLVRIKLQFLPFQVIRHFWLSWLSQVILALLLHHRSNAYELFTYCSSLIYFPVAIVTITTKYQKHYFAFVTLLLPLPSLSYYFATKHFAADTKFPGVVELTTQLLILKSIIWLPLCRINKFGLNTLPSKAVAILSE